MTLNCWCPRCYRLTDHDHIDTGVPVGDGYSVNATCEVCDKRPRRDDVMAGSAGWVVPGKTSKEALAWVKAQGGAA